MHIITVMKYSGKKEVIMCKSWLYLLKRFNPKALVTIFYQGEISGLRDYARSFGKVYFVKLDEKYTRKVLDGGFAHHPVQELRLGVWRKTSKMGITKFIYLDADAWVLAPLTDWWKIISQKPYIAVTERLESGKVFFNAGVHSYSSSLDFITYQKLVDQYYLDGKRIWIQAGEQGIVNAFFRRIGYNYIHPKIGFEYNTLAKYCKVERADDTDIRVYSGKYPLTKKIIRRLTLSRPGWAEGWKWWGFGRRVKILHSFGGPGYRFWDLPECNLLWNYCKNKVS